MLCFTLISSCFSFIIEWVKSLQCLWNVCVHNWYHKVCWWFQLYSLSMTHHTFPYTDNCWTASCLFVRVGLLALCCMFVRACVWFTTCGNWTLCAGKGCPVLAMCLALTEVLGLCVWLRDEEKWLKVHNHIQKSLNCLYTQTHTSGDVSSDRLCEVHILFQQQQQLLLFITLVNTHC